MSVRKWDVQATGSGRRSNVQILVDLNIPHLCAVGGGSLRNFPRIYIWWDPLSTECTLGGIIFKLNVQDGLGPVIESRSSPNSRRGVSVGFELYPPESCGSSLLLRISLLRKVPSEREYENKCMFQTVLLEKH